MSRLDIEFNMEPPEDEYGEAHDKLSEELMANDCEVREFLESHMCDAHVQSLWDAWVATRMEERMDIGDDG